MLFKKGIFHMIEKASNKGLPITIAPFCLVGSRTAWPKGRIIPVSGSKVLLKFCDHVKVEKGTGVDDLMRKTREVIEGGLESVCINENGDYDIDGAFGKGIEINMKKEFLFEAILLTIPPIVTLALALSGFYN